MPLSLPRTLLHAEGGAVLLGSVIAYSHFGYGWGWFLLLLLAPDLTAIGYLVSKRVGSMTYNAGHTYLVPAALGGLAATGVAPAATGLALIWSAHIGMDRLVGYGLKYPTSFQDTHLQRT